MLYFALVYPRILYGIEVYANTYLTYLHEPMILNNRILRIIQHKPIATHTNELYKEFKSLPIKKLFKFQILTHIHNIYYEPNKLPDIFHATMCFNHDIHGYQTRSCNDFHRSSMQSKHGNKISSSEGAKLWNNLPPNLKSTISIFIFKKLLKQFLIHNDI